ncbi:MAG: hypothetical protein LBF34_00660 [Puniceicoccales bacterium]|nr:hypothetical protein [Puniceicoccales bacterium]
MGFDTQQDGGDMYKFMVNLRFFLPEIFASKLLPEDLIDIDYFLWLDSDLLVPKKIFSIWRIAREYPHQRMFGANLMHRGVRLEHDSDLIRLKRCTA